MPFGEILEKINIELTEEDEEDEDIIEMMSDPKWKKVYDMESKFSEKLDSKFEKMASDQFQEDDYYLCLMKALIIVLSIHIIFAVLQCLKRPDFLDISIGVMAILTMYNPRFQKRRYFRFFAAGLALSFVYDLFWLIANWYVYQYGLEEENHRKTETNVTKFVLFISFFSMLLRIPLTLLVWRCSLNFRDIIKANRALLGVYDNNKYGEFN